MKIKHLKLNCANLEEQKHFYTKKFKFKVVREGDGELCLQMGNSQLTFIENKLKKSYYHFALNIPFPSVEKAMKWLDKLVDILESEGNKIQEFPNWKARSIYFFDPAGNIVEFIGRERLEEEGRKTFNEKDILNISEVGLPVFQVNEAFEMIHRQTQLPKFDCDSSTFCVCGDDEGLFIVVDKAEKTWFPTDEPAKAYPLSVEFDNDRGESFVLEMQNGTTSVSKI